MTVFLEVSSISGRMDPFANQLTRSGTSCTTDWHQTRIDASIASMQALMAQSWQMEADEVAEVAVRYADALVKRLKQQHEDKAKHRL